MKHRLKVNGTQHEVDVLPDTPLLWVLRDNLNLTGAKFGCGVGTCGCCTVLVAGKAVRSCSLPISEVKGDVLTIEGLSKDGSHPLQKAWVELDVPQCGYCQTGQIMAAAALLSTNKKPTDQQIDSVMDGVCRCGTYDRIRKAVKLAAKGMK